MNAPARAAWACVLVMVALAAGCKGDAPADAAPDRTAPLPAATKGYELYAWDETGTLAFTLITGTNRLKTAAEITAPDGDVEQGEWVVLHGEGAGALARVLARVPDGTSVVLASLDGLPPLGASGRAEVQRLLAEAGHAP